MRRTLLEVPVRQTPPVSTVSHFEAEVHRLRTQLAVASVACVRQRSARQLHFGRRGQMRYPWLQNAILKLLQVVDKLSQEEPFEECLLELHTASSKHTG